MSDLAATPTRRAFWLTVVGVIGCFLVFALVLYLGYLPSRAKQLDPAANLTPEERQERNLLTPDERRARLADLQAKEAKALHTYDWVDKGKGIVRLPRDRAVELTVRELQEKQARQPQPQNPGG